MGWVDKLPVPKHGKLPIGGLVASSVVIGIILGSLANLYLDRHYLFNAKRTMKARRPHYTSQKGATMRVLLHVLFYGVPEAEAQGVRTGKVIPPVADIKGNEKARKQNSGNLVHKARLAMVT
ncbi:hypothetical protein MAR_023562 [Mya arenaria]|uniref:Uncharacterized protein n=1 Tax=Mya arenaria TaxID=6604 RepID=A0ABY7DP66_MYAAR|nr:hypothetical protein MAR_023562 [Mya arenaria]